MTSPGRPVLTIIAGANGAGKSTLTSSYPALFAAFPLLDPDAIARVLQPTRGTSSALAAGRQVLEQVALNLQARRSFAVETTFSGKNYLQVMHRARELGFEVVLIYIGTESVEINLRRIADRVFDGGHSVPPEDVRRRYVRSFQNLPLVVSRADHAILFDNSSEAGYQLVGVLEECVWTWFPPLPRWTKTLPDVFI